MRLSEYFKDVKGTGVLATADSAGKVDVAFYSKPHFEDEQTVKFIMADRLSHVNLQSNPHAAYLFKEEGERFVGKRLSLTKIKEKDDADLINKMMKEYHPNVYDKYKDLKKYLVYFRINKVLPLIGDGE